MLVTFLSFQERAAPLAEYRNCSAGNGLPESQLPAPWNGAFGGSGGVGDRVVGHVTALGHLIFRKGDGERRKRLVHTRVTRVVSDAFLLKRRAIGTSKKRIGVEASSVTALSPCLVAAGNKTNGD